MPRNHCTLLKPHCVGPRIPAEINYLEHAGNHQAIKHINIVKMCQTFQTLHCKNVATVFSILFAFSSIKGPEKELRLSFMSGEKYVNKIFSGSESAKVSPN